jgi:hypothetical protein
MYEEKWMKKNRGEMGRYITFLPGLIITVLILNILPAFADKIEFIKSPTLNQEDVKDLLDVWLSEKEFPIHAEKKQHKLIGIYQKDMEATVYFTWSYFDPATGKEHFEKGKIDLIRLNTGEWFDPVAYTLLFKRVKD